jgi:hypothetical protein
MNERTTDTADTADTGALAAFERLVGERAVARGTRVITAASPNAASAAAAMFAAGGKSAKPISTRVCNAAPPASSRR